MKAAVDTNVFVDILINSPRVNQSKELLHQAFIEGTIVVCPRKMICPACGTQVEITCRACGRELTVRQHILTDFLIGAHAQTQADQLLSHDRDFIRRYFPSLACLPT